MPRRKKRILKRDIGVDPRYGSELVQKFINVIMVAWQKKYCSYIVYDAIDILIKKARAIRIKHLIFFIKHLIN